MNFRTDMASEAHKLWKENADKISSLRGVKAEEQKVQGLTVTAVEILDEEGSKILQKPCGLYYTLELPQHFERGAEAFANAAGAAAELTKRCIKGQADSVLIAALGNPDITPDALGNLAASYTLVTRHLKQTSPNEFPFFSSLALCRTGVLGTSGIESAAHIAMLCEKIKPDLVLVIDALAGADADRLCRTIQFTTAGLAPGSGVGNDRQALNETQLGVPVVAIGMPTVIDAQFFGGPAGMFVTPRNIDSIVRSAARVIAYGVNLAVHREISIADIDALLG